VDNLKALDPKRPIREADILCGDLHVRLGPKGDIRLLDPRKRTFLGVYEYTP